MRTKRIIMIGALSGLILGITLFIGGAIASRIIYGPQFVPDGKFEPSQINPFYFFWTKIVIGLFFGLLFSTVYELLPLAKRINSCWKGLKYGFIFWTVITLWDLSHPLIYDSIYTKDQLFWNIYTLIGFLGFGVMFGYLCKKKYNLDYS